VRFIETPGTVGPIAIPPAYHSLEPWKYIRIPASTSGMVLPDGPGQLGDIG